MPDLYEPLSPLEEARAALQVLDALIPTMTADMPVSAYNIAGRSFTLRSQDEARRLRATYYAQFCEAQYGDIHYADNRTAVVS